MAEHFPQPQTPAIAPGPAPMEVTAGQLLKAARLKAGVHLAVLSVALKVPVRQLEALEADQYLKDQSPVFARAMVASVCRQLHLDPTSILAMMPMGVVSLDGPSVAAPQDMGVLKDVSPLVSAKVVLAVVLLLTLLAALIWLPNPSQWPWASAPLAGVADKSTSESSAAAVSSAGGDVVPLGGITVVASEPSAQAPEPLAAVTPIPAAGSSAQPELIFTASDKCWIEVRDADNQVVWMGILSTGESQRLLMSKPLRVVVGRADALQVKFKGQGFDLSPHVQSNVARFEVKP